jgi:hypothetical protein
VAGTDVSGKGVFKLFDFGSEHKGRASENTGEDLEKLRLERAVHG